MKWSHGNRPYFALLRATDLSDGDIYRLSDGVRFSKSELPSEALVIELPRFWKKNASDGGCYPVVALSKEWANTNQSCVSKPKDCFAPTSPHVLPGVVRPETGIDPLRPRGNSATSPRRSPHSLTVLERIKRLSGLKVQDRESYATAWTWSCKRPDLRDNLFQETGPAEARSCGDEQLKRLLEVLRESRKSYLQEAPTARF